MELSGYVSLYVCVAVALAQNKIIYNNIFCGKIAILSAQCPEGANYPFLGLDELWIHTQTSFSMILEHDGDMPEFLEKQDQL